MYNFIPVRSSSNEKRKFRGENDIVLTEDSIVVPIPRKLASVHSSSHASSKRKSKNEDLLFGEAGQELQTILRSCRNSEHATFREGSGAVRSTSACLLNSEKLDSVQRFAESSSAGDKDMDVVQDGIVKEMENDRCEPEDENLEMDPYAKIPRLSWTLMPSPPQRSSNPLTLNSPFEKDMPFQSEVPHVLRPIRPVKRERTIKHDSADLSRFRSSSWPILSNLIASVTP